MKPGGEKTGLAEAFADAWAGIVASAQGRNFRIMLGFALVAIVLGVLFRISLAEWLVIVVCIGLVLAGECINTALEDVVDLACPEQHQLAKRAKDAAAGAVFLLSLASFIVGVAIFLPRILGA